MSKFIAHKPLDGDIAAKCDGSIINPGIFVCLFFGCLNKLMEHTLNLAGALLGFQLAS